MATLVSVERATFQETEIEGPKEGLEFTWIVNGARKRLANIRARTLTAKAFPLQWLGEHDFPPLRLISINKIDESIFEPRPFGPSGLVKTWRIILFMPTENDALETPVENILERASEIINRG